MSLFLLAVVLFCAQVYYFAGSNALRDDAFILFRYAKNFAEGHGLVWNVGENPVEGYTNFLWTVMLGASLYLGFIPEITSQILGVGFALGTLLVLFRWARARQTTESLAWPAVPSLLLAANSMFAFYAVSGMGTTVFAFGITVASYYYLERRRSKYHATVSSFLFAIVALIRPEGLGVFAVATLHQLYLIYIDNLSRRAVVKRISTWLIPFIVIVGAHEVWRIVYYGYPLPNTFYAKHTGGGPFELGLGILYAYDFTRTYAAFLLPFALIPLWKGPRTRQFVRSSYGTAMLGLFYAYIVLVGGDVQSAFPSYRLFVPVLPLLYLAAFWGLADLIDWARDWSPRARGSLQGVAAVVLTTLTLAGAASPAYHNYESLLILNHGLLRFKNDSLQVLGKDFDFEEPSQVKCLKRHAPRDASIAVTSAGMIPYYSGFKAIDRMGLNDEHIAHLPKQYIGFDSKRDLEYVLAQKPTFIQTNIPFEQALAHEQDRRAQDRAGAASRPLWANEEFQENYRLLADCGGYRTSIYKRITP